MYIALDSWIALGSRDETFLGGEYCHKSGRRMATGHGKEASAQRLLLSHPQWKLRQAVQGRPDSRRPLGRAVAMNLRIQAYGRLDGALVLCASIACLIRLAGLRPSQKGTGQWAAQSGRQADGGG